jgi:lipopolysaccharide transport system ATP-binding protein
MSSSLAAAVQNVSKCYHIYPRNVDRLKQAFSFGRVKHYRQFWALKNISFQVERGDTVGIVGANGSGKSTLLQVLYGVLQPTSGKVQVNGKIGGLLELGAGFNPEETGRENIMINAAIMGIPAREIPAMYEKIAEFADIGKFIDQPIKIYSTGMAVRLGFALQISIPKDILIIDEALAVGDELFQRRCYGALEKFKDEGGTILFVSHSAAAVKQLCRKAIFLDHGRIVQQGNCRIVIENYHKFLYMQEPQRWQFKDQLMSGGEARDFDDSPPVATAPAPADISAADSMASIAHAPPRPENAGRRVQGVDLSPPPAQWEDDLITRTAMPYHPIGAQITNPRIETLDGQVVNVLNRQERYRFCYRVQFTRDARNVIFGMLIKATSGLELGGGAHDSPEGYLKQVFAGLVYDITFEFTACLLPAVYYFNCGVLGTCGDYDGFLHRVIDATAFRMRNVFSKVHSGHIDFDYRTTCKMEPVASIEAQREGIGLESGSAG